MLNDGRRCGGSAARKSSSRTFDEDEWLALTPVEARTAGKANGGVGMVVGSHVSGL